MPNLAQPAALKSSTNKRQQGSIAEQAALTLLISQGLHLIASNFYCRGGEIDLIVQDSQQTLIFVEVRMRNHRLVSAAESITQSKQRRIMRCAEYFLLKHPQFQYRNLRFDVVLFNNLLESPEWITNAFDAT